MLGHQVFCLLRGEHDVKATLRKDLVHYNRFGIFTNANSYAGVKAQSIDKIQDLFEKFKPHAAVNAIGIIKQRKSSRDSVTSIEVNSLFPHRLALVCKEYHTRMIHISTDCVFSGKKGNYTEADAADAEDIYGRSKLLGEVVEEHCLTLRTSMIGPELHRKKSLLEWFLAQKNKIKGYKSAIFSGFTTYELSRVIERMLTQFPEANGLYHVSADPISKYDLLSMIRQKFDLPMQIEPDYDFQCDRSLESIKFREEFHYDPPSWPEMIKELSERLKYE